MYCSKCGKLVEDNIKFCPNCGNAMGTTNTEQPTQVPDAKPPYAPENYLIWTILSTLFCCWPVGIVSIVHATKVESKFNQGDYNGALDASQKAKKWAIISAISAGVFWLLYILVIIILAVVAGEL
jgi:hypothetical protein